MAKEVTGFIKLQIKGGAANPAPPVGPALGCLTSNEKDLSEKTVITTGRVFPA